MSYLAALRLHFAGRFQAAPSTVNNAVEHYDVASFKEEYKLRQEPGKPNGLWNPRGDADWRLLGCPVTGAWHANGAAAAADDPVLATQIADSDRRVAAKLVDLDPQQQLCSVIWGLEVRICDASGGTLVRGRFEPAPFVDIWSRAQGPGGGGDIGACAAYQSVLADLEWADGVDSPWLRELRAAATDGLLSIRFNVDGYNMTFGSPDFTRGRIVGTIGIAHASEPRHFVAGRQFMPAPAAGGGGFFSPAGSINFCTAVVDDARRKVLLELGNALPTAQPGGPPLDHGDLWLGYVARGDTAPTPIGRIDYLTSGWYERTAGVVEVPVTDAQLAAIADARLALRFANVASDTLESASGLYARPDNLVYRLAPGDVADVDVVATRMGHPYPGAAFVATLDPSGLQGGAVPVAEPSSALALAIAPAGADGRTTLHITASDPGNPRGYIDGQVYGVRVALADQPPGCPVDPWTFVSVLVFDAFVPDEPVTWWGSLQPIFQQYANLYPVMDRFLDMADYDSVCENRALLRLAFGLDPADPNAMPATRDLSHAKRAAILRWLDTVGPDGKPLLGTPPERAEAVDEGFELAAAALPEPKPMDPGGLHGGKAAAAARRMVIPGDRP